jgi:GNAT superfamily N-acetyltransferase
MNQQFIIRKAILEDAPQIAQVNIQSWKETYYGIMPEQRMANLNLERCTKSWMQTLSEDSTNFVATINKRIIGYVSGGKNRQNVDCESGLGDACDCELMALYILQDFHKQGIGKTLFQTFVGTMQNSGYTSMVTWVAEKNPATGFYQKMGGEKIDCKTLQICNEAVSVIAFRYRFFIAGSSI